MRKHRGETVTCENEEEEEGRKSDWFFWFDLISNDPIGSRRLERNRFIMSLEQLIGCSDGCGLAWRMLILVETCKSQFSWWVIAKLKIVDQDKMGWKLQGEIFYVNTISLFGYYTIIIIIVVTLT